MDVQKPLVSVIIPAYNVSRFIEGTVLSAMQQTYVPLEIIVVDDGSTDETAAIVRSLQQKDARIRLYRQTNSGVSVARNHGIAEAKGDYIAFLDGDDLWHPTKIEKQMQVMLNAPEDTALVYTFSRMVDNDGYLQGNTGAFVLKRGHVFHELLIYNFIGNGSVALVKRSMMPTPFPFDPEQHGNDDTYFHLQIAAQHRIDVAPEFLVGYRWNTGQNKSSNLARQIDSYESMMKRIQQRFPNIPTRIIKWSEAGFYLSHVQTQFKKGHYRTAGKLFVRHVLTTPSYIVSEPFRRLLWLAGRFIKRKLLREKPPRLHYFEVNP